MSIWEKMGFGGYKGFSRESDHLLRSAVELAGDLGCEKADTGHLLLAICSRTTGQPRVFWQTSKFANQTCAVSWPSAAAARPCIWTGMPLRRTCAARWTTPSLGPRTPI